MLKLCLISQSSFWMLAPNGKQAEEIYKVAKEVVRHADDVYRLAPQSFWESIPTWVWVVIGIVVAIIIIFKAIES